MSWPERNKFPPLLRYVERFDWSVEVNVLSYWLEVDQITIGYNIYPLEIWR